MSSFYLQKSEMKDKIQLIPMIADRTQGLYLNQEYLPTIIRWAEEYDSIFTNDFIPALKEYNPWLTFMLEFLNGLYPWFFVVLVNDKPQGAVWVERREYYGDQCYSAEVSGMAARGGDPQWSSAAMGMLTQMVFEELSPHIIRAFTHPLNRGARWCLQRIGYGHPETQRCWKIVNEQPITGIILSMTREEFNHGWFQNNLKQQD